MPGIAAWEYLYSRLVVLGCYIARVEPKTLAETPAAATATIASPR